MIDAVPLCFAALCIASDATFSFARNEDETVISPPCATAVRRCGSQAQCLSPEIGDFQPIERCLACMAPFERSPSLKFPLEIYFPVRCLMNVIEAVSS